MIKNNVIAFLVVVLCASAGISSQFTQDEQTFIGFAKQGNLAQLKKISSSTIGDAAFRAALTESVFAKSRRTTEFLLVSHEFSSAALEFIMVHAAASGLVNEVELLVKYGADIDAVVNGETAYMAAARHGKRDVVRALLARGAQKPGAEFRRTYFVIAGGFIGLATYLFWRGLNAVNRNVHVASEVGPRRYHGPGLALRFVPMNPSGTVKIPDAPPMPDFARSIFEKVPEYGEKLVAPIQASCTLCKKGLGDEVFALACGHLCDKSCLRDFIVQALPSEFRSSVTKFLASPETLVADYAIRGLSVSSLQYLSMVVNSITDGAIVYLQKRLAIAGNPADWIFAIAYNLNTAVYYKMRCPNCHAHMIR